jgi:K+-sensing histidine kinase KdpD
LVANCAQRLTDLLLAQREASGMLQADVDAHSPADLLQELATGYVELFPTLDIEVNLEQAPITAFYDVFLVRLALGNALHNACHHARKQVQLSVYGSNDSTVFQITDDGPGFPSNFLALGAAAPCTPGQTGTGLGLYLAGRIAALHRLGEHAGSIELSNADAGGGIFRMTLP